MEQSTKSVYVVQGSAGEYEDSSEWVVAVFTNQRRAEKFAEICSQKAKKSYEEWKVKLESWETRLDSLPARVRDWPEMEHYPEPNKFPEDPDADIEYNTCYYVSEVPLNPEPAKD